MRKYLNFIIVLPAFLCMHVQGIWKSYEDRDLFMFDEQLLHGTLLDVLAGLKGGVVRAHVSEDLGNVVIDDHRTMGRLAHGWQILALHQQLCLECSLIGDVVVEVMASDVDDHLASAAVYFGALALLALERLKSNA